MDDDFSCLEKICPYCDKTGIVANPKFIEWHINGCINKQPNEIMIKCPICDGSCVIPTKLGIGILELVEKYRHTDN